MFFKSKSILICSTHAYKVEIDSTTPFRTVKLIDIYKYQKENGEFFLKENFVTETDFYMGDEDEKRDMEKYISELKEYGYSVYEKARIDIFRANPIRIDLDHKV